MPKKGYKQTKEHKEKLREAMLGKVSYWRGKRRPEMLGENNSSWKGKRVGYRSLHYWVENKLGKSDICEYCGRSELIGHQIHWANKSRYLRELNDWIRLCASCHKAYDRDLVSV